MFSHTMELVTHYLDMKLLIIVTIGVGAVLVPFGHASIRAQSSIRRPADRCRCLIPSDYEI